MVRKCLKRLAAGLLLLAPAPAMAITGNIQEVFVCPSANCTTSCVGPGGPQTIKGYKKLSAFMIGLPDRLWLQTDDKTTIVLGVGDRCTFGGDGEEITQAPGPTIHFPPVTNNAPTFFPPPVNNAPCFGPNCPQR